MKYVGEVIAVFGYIRTFPPELRGRESVAYRAVYCGLCRELGHIGGQTARLSLSYDMTYLALLRLTTNGQVPTVRPKRCFIHPLRKEPAVLDSDDVRYAACLTVLLSYYKLLDDRQDERGIKRLRASLMLPGYARRRRSLMKNRKKPGRSGLTGQTVETVIKADALIGATMEKLRQSEAAREMSVDKPADTFGKMMGELASLGLTDKTAAALCRGICYRTGRWVYITDAADDYADDVKRGRYNPFVCLLGAGLTNGEVPAVLPADKCEEIDIALKCELTAVTDAMNLCPDYPGLESFRGALDNIHTFGMPCEAKRILTTDVKEKRKKNERSV